MRRSLAVGLVVCLALAACGTGVTSPPPPSDGGEERDAGKQDPPDAGPPGPVLPDLEVGTGTSTFEALTEGQGLNIVEGPQGGFHLWTSLRANKKALVPDRADVHLKLFFSGAQLSDNNYRLNLVESGEYYEWYALQMLVPDPVAVDGQTVTMRLELTDNLGHAAADERHVVAHKPP